MHDHDLTRWSAVAAALAALAAFPMLTAAEPAVIHSEDVARWSLDRHDSSVKAAAAAKTAPVELVLDDGSREADVGFTGAAAFQFLWFNRFDPPAPGRVFDLEQIQVLFPPGPDVVPGAAVQLVVFTDPDADPTTGANLVTAFDDVIRFADGTTFSVYPVDPPLRLPPGSGDLLVGVVNRFVVSGVSPPSRPAALDTTTSAGRSWVAVWSTDPPDPPSLPSDDVLETIDFIEPGNWMIRVSGTPAATPGIPSLGGMGLAVLAALLTFAGVAMLRRRVMSPVIFLRDTPSR